MSEDPPSSDALVLKRRFVAAAFLVLILWTALFVWLFAMETSLAEEAAPVRLRRCLLSLASIWLVGAALIGIASVRIRGGLEARRQAEQLLREMNERLSRTEREKDTSERTLVARLAAAQERLIESEKASALGLVVSGIAHELNTPLGSISSSAAAISVIAERILRDWGSGALIMDAAERALVVSFIRACADAVERRGPCADDPETGERVRRFLHRHALPIDPEAEAELSAFPIDFDLEPFLPLFSSRRSGPLLLAAATIAGLIRCNALIAYSVAKAADDVDALSLFSSDRAGSDAAFCDAAELLEAALGAFDPARLASVDLERDYRPGLPAFCERRYLERALRNLIKNALQAMDYRGRLRLSVRGNDRSALIEVANEGPTLDPSVKAKLFSPFFTTKKRGESTGLGLFLSKRMVERNGGTLSYSRSGNLNVFSVSLPAFKRVAAETDAEAAGG